ncbi:3-deoxy-7-phosphoheptulonate synthase [Thermosulfuriphilus ammonigenes]|uniref:3-deoxy-7-phosphoheptulonate synthase n=1 Tax=Thermosulfuriphilus ammonigenes TaxID=1936021 RepID=A0A6G7PWD6_9BACT|nr:3-deoxy-7-phosphoheptulonate synthase [Thermosulfuriphilus ammonigenes]MBA2847793.1 3-deoxy-7-phosphoheptulonate synthase [Thermosulfuriphilus ammonigenes]QIJ72005.1 3-deoxy-7-phosphoheptulonate synthase [Thermosulfuriphilus ammonigenes]
MLVVMAKGATEEDIRRVEEVIRGHGWEAKVIPGGERTAIGVLRNKGPIDPGIFLQLPGVKEAIPVSKPYKLVSREMKPVPTQIKLPGGLNIGDGQLILMAGPCAVESLNQAMTIARAVKAAGARVFRAGAFKPRTSPYSFQGLGEEGLKILAKVREETGLLIVTEATDHEVLDLVEEYADIIQIGARNMQNYRLLRRAGQAQKPILLKRGMCASVEELLMAAEYIMAEGNSQIILCERGIRTFANHSRNTLDLGLIPYLRRETHLPIVVDPSHAAGRRDLVIPLAKAAAAVGVDGLLVEVHHQPEKALSDGPQSLYPRQFEELVNELKAMNLFLEE